MVTINGFYIGELYIQPQIIASLIIVFLLCLFSVLVGRKVDRLRPSDKAPFIISAMEILVGIINNYVRSNIGRRWKGFAPYFVMLALYLTLANICGIFGLVPPTCSWNVTLALAIITFLMIHVTGVRSLGLKGYLKTYFSPLPFFFPINLIGEVAFPVALSLRLFGNIISGSVISKLIYGLTGWWGALIMPPVHAIFDIALGLIQVVVFVLLSVVFISQKVDESELIIEN